VAEKAWIVMDTNFASRGKYQNQRLRKVFDRLVARGHEVIVPEVVVWEWAEHLHRKLRFAHDVVDSARVDANASGLPIIVANVDLPTSERICEGIVEDLRAMPGVTVQGALPQDAARAIRDQVLQVGMGSRRSGTKTGAADSLVLATARRAHEDLFEERVVVLCTNDAELADAAQDCDTPLIVVRDLSALWRWHGTTQPLDDDIARAIERWLVDLHDSDVDGPLQRLTVDPMGLGRVDHHLLRVAADLDSRDDHYQLEVQLHRFEKVWATDVEVVDGDELPHLVLATITAVGDVVIDDWFFNADGDLEHDQGAAQAQTTTSVVAEFDEGWSIVGVDVTEVAHVRPLGDEEPWWTRTEQASTEKTG
jgi:rRNA-processing protein FCF1